MGVFVKFIAANMVILASQGCNGTQLSSSNTGGNSVKNEKVSSEENAKTMSGTVTKTGRMCPTMRNDQGETYSFDYLPEDLAEGENIEVTVAEAMSMSTTQCDHPQLPWSKITRPTSGEKPAQTWTHGEP